MQRLMPFFAATCLTGAAAGQTVVNFDFYPGPDGLLGTPDDIPIVAPTNFSTQTLQLTDEFEIVGVRFAEPVVNDKNEILNNASFSTPPAATDPNLLASQGAQVIEFSFTDIVHSVSAIIGISGGTDRMTIYDAVNLPLGTAVGDDEVVTLASNKPIVRVVIAPETGSTPTIDNLEFILGFDCYPDCNGDGALNLADFGCFQTKFALGDPYADCNNDQVLNLADFGCFQTAFALSCP